MRTRLGHESIERRPAEFAAADEGLLAVLERLEQAKNYTAWILDLIGPHVSGRILEVGAGRGAYSPYFAGRGHLTALEPSEAHCMALRERLHDRRNQLLALIHNVGFQKVTAKYVNMPGFFAWWLVVRVLGRVPTAGRMTSIYSRFFIPVIRRVERLVRPPIGQSLLVVAQRS
jgi:SAM-dependent methyltransferase